MVKQQEKRTKVRILVELDKDIADKIDQCGQSENRKRKQQAEHVLNSWARNLEATQSTKNC